MCEVSSGGQDSPVSSAIRPHYLDQLLEQACTQGSASPQPLSLKREVFGTDVGRARREQLRNVQIEFSSSQGQNLALTGLLVPRSLDSDNLTGCTRDCTCIPGNQHEVC